MGFNVYVVQSKVQIKMFYCYVGISRTLGFFLGVPLEQ